MVSLLGPFGMSEGFLGLTTIIIYVRTLLYCTSMKHSLLACKGH